MSLDGIGFIGLIIMLVVVFTWKKCEDIQNERDAKQDIEYMVRNGMPVYEAYRAIEQAEDMTK